MNERQLLRVRRKFGMVFQGAALFDSMTVAENVAFGLRRARAFDRGGNRQARGRRAGHGGFAGHGEKKPAELSGGMRKRVGLARAIIYEPQFVLYDEPTTGLDPIVSDSIDQLIMRVRDQLKVTSVVVTHDMRSARRVGNHVFMLHDKKIYAHGTPEKFFASRTPIVRQFVDGVADAKETVFITMEKSRLESKVGLFVFIGLALLAVMMIQFSKGTSLFRGTYALKLHAANIGGLKQKAGVLLAGVPVGSVQDIQLDCRAATTSPSLCKSTRIIRFTTTRGLSSSNPAFSATNMFP